MTRRDAVRLLGMSAAALAMAPNALTLPFHPKLQSSKDTAAPPLAPGAPNSPERIALIDTFKTQSEGLQNKYEARTYKGDFTMPYRLFRPEGGGKLPLVVF